MKKIAVILLIFLLINFVEGGEGDGGTSKGSFLNFGSSARSLALANTFTGLCDDASATYFNPAGLMQLSYNEITALHVVLYEDTYYDFISFVYPTRKIGSFGLSLVSLYSANFENRDSSNNSFGTFSESEIAVMLSYGKDVSPDLFWGINLKLVNEVISSYKDTSIGMDIGLLYIPLEFLSLGANIKNILQPNIKYISTYERYPLDIRLGLAIKLLNDNFILVCDGIKTGEKNIKLSSGIEVHPISFLTFRGGVNENEWAAGVGFKYGGYKLDYALGINNDLGLSHRISLSWMFGVFALEVKSSETIFSPVGKRDVTKIKLKGTGKFGIKKWEFNIKDEKDNLIKSMKGKGEPPEELNWDGRNENGERTPDGKYTFELKLYDRIGNVEVAGEEVEINTVLPETKTKMEIR
ncbi:MAG: PorV/PorQ family protein [Candidatus Firestonebacteria bacterium]